MILYFVNFEWQLGCVHTYSDLEDITAEASYFQASPDRRSSRHKVNTPTQWEWNQAEELPDQHALLSSCRSLRVESHKVYTSRNVIKSQSYRVHPFLETAI